LKELEKHGKARVEKIGMNPDSARRAAFWLQEKGVGKGRRKGRRNI